MRLATRVCVLILPADAHPVAHATSYETEDHFAPRLWDGPFRHRH